MANAMSKANSRQNSRHKAKYQTYRSAGRREMNKARKILRHIERQGLVPPPNELRNALKRLPAHLVRSAAKSSPYNWDVVAGWIK